MLRYGEGPPPGWQTAYGIEVKMPGHPFAVNKAVFMDFRQSDPEVEAGSNGAFAAESGVWRVPSFLYVLPVDEDTVFVEETCLVARVQVPFDELKRRLYRRLSRMGLSVEKENIIEEEARWIPLAEVRRMRLVRDVGDVMDRALPLLEHWLDEEDGEERLPL